MSNHATAFPGFLDLGDGAAVDAFQLEHDPDATAAAFRVVAGEARCPACGRIRRYHGMGHYRCWRCMPQMPTDAIDPFWTPGTEQAMKPAA